MRSRLIALSELLVSLFTDEELSRFLWRHYREVHDELPAGLSLAALADRGVQALDKRGMIDDALFDALLAARPLRAPEIDRVRGPGGPRTPSALRWGGIALGLAVAGVALFLTIPRPGADAPEATPAGDAPTEEGTPPPARAATNATTSTSESNATTATNPSNATTSTNTRSAAPRCPEGMVPVVPSAGEVGPFCLDALEVTRADYGLRCPAAPSPADDVVLAKAAARCEREGPSEAWGRHPVAWVDPSEATRFCAARGRRLPTRDEWRVAAETELAAWTSGSFAACANLCDQGCWEVEYEGNDDWFVHRDPYPRSSPVGSFPCPSALGVRDVHGNARELVVDGDDFSVCGAGWRSNTHAHVEPAYWCRPQRALGRQQDVGFRCAHDLDPAPR